VVCGGMREDLESNGCCRRCYCFGDVSWEMRRCRGTHWAVRGWATICVKRYACTATKQQMRKIREYNNTIVNAIDFDLLEHLRGQNIKQVGKRGIGVE